MCVCVCVRTCVTGNAPAYACHSKGLLGVQQCHNATESHTKSTQNTHTQVFWTREVIQSIESAGAEGLKAYGEKCTDELNKIVGLVRGQLTSLERATCGSLVVVDVHARDVVVDMTEKGVSDIRDFNW